MMNLKNSRCSALANAGNPTSVNQLVNNTLRGLYTTLFFQGPKDFYSPIKKKVQKRVKGVKFHLTAAPVGIETVQRDSWYSFVTSYSRLR